MRKENFINAIIVFAFEKFGFRADIMMPHFSLGSNIDPFGLKTILNGYVRFKYLTKKPILPLTWMHLIKSESNGLFSGFEVLQTPLKRFSFS